MVVASLLRHYKPEKAPPGFNLKTLIKQFMSQTGAAHAGESDAAAYEWRVLFVAGMWFQDLFNYDQPTSSAPWTTSLSVDLGNPATSSAPSKR